MLSRVAESIFWFSRYIERAENTARFLAVHCNLEMELSASLKDQWEPLIKTTFCEEFIWHLFFLDLAIVCAKYQPV